MAFLNARTAKTAAELITGSGGIKSVAKVESQTTPLIKGSSTVGGTKITTTGKTVTYSTPITNVSKATNGTTGAAKLTENIAGGLSPLSKQQRNPLQALSRALRRPPER